MSDGKDDNPFDPERMAARRADKLSRAMEQARQRRLNLADGAQPENDQSGDGGGDGDAKAAPIKRKPKLPPPPPPDPQDWRALGLPPGALGKPVTKPTALPQDPLILGTGDTRVVGLDEGQDTNVPDAAVDGAVDDGAQVPFETLDEPSSNQPQTPPPVDASTLGTWTDTSDQFAPPLAPASAMRLPEDEGQGDWAPATEPLAEPFSPMDPSPDGDEPYSITDAATTGLTTGPTPIDETPAAPRALFGGAPVAPEPDHFDIAAAPQPDEPAIAPRPKALLQLSGVHTDIGRYRVLQGVDLEVPEGQVTMLLGRNGVGKTTTLRTIMGLWHARSGEIMMDGRNLATMQPAAIARSGIGYVPEDMGVFGDLTVEENMRLGALTGRPNRTRLEWLLSAFPALKTFWTRPAATLSGGQKQMLSIARTMVEPRRLYLIDEPTKGLAPAIVATLAGALRELKHEGATILMVEQNFAVAKALGDTCAVMDDGKVTWNGSMAELAEDAELQARLMGLHLEPGH